MKKILVGVAAVGVLAFCVAASAAPQGDDGYTLPEVLQGRARVVHVETPSLINPRGEANAEAEVPSHPQNIVIEVINDEAFARGVTATGAGAEAVVFSQMLDSGYGYFHDNEPGTMQWSQMIFGNGFVPGTDLSSWTARVYVSAYNFNAFNSTGGFTIELWDGDPLGAQSTVCAAVPAPIAGTSCTWTDLPEGVVYDLKCIFAAKVPVYCTEVFGVVMPGDVCRWAWRMSDGFITGGAMTKPQVGAGDFLGAIWGCDQHGYCATASGYTAGFCCDDQTGEPVWWLATTRMRIRTTGLRPVVAAMQV